MMPVFSADHLTDAHLIQGYLQANGIASEVRGGALNSARGEVSPLPGTLPEIWIMDDSQAGPAIEAIAAYQNRRVAPTVGAPWQCGKCGEHLQPQFNTCWKCGSIHPAFK